MQVTSECSSDKIRNKTIVKTNAALEGNCEVPYCHEFGDESYCLSSVFVGHEDETRRSGARRRWKLEELRGLEFDRETDTIFTSDLTHAFKDLCPARRAEVLDLLYGDVGDVGYGSPSQVVDADLVARINARLERQRRDHPSFLLLEGGPDEGLFPKGERIPNSARTVRVDDKTVSFRDFVRDSWAAG